MAKEINKLTDLEIKNARPKEKPYSLSDGDGLSILITPKASENGGKYWRFQYSIGGKRDTLRFGVYPAVTLAKARQMKDEVKAKIATGKNPREDAKKKKISAGQGDTFEAVALAYLKGVKEPGPRQLAKTYVPKQEGRLRTYLLPKLGNISISALTPVQVDALKESILAKGQREIARHPGGMVETVRRVLTLGSQVFEFARRKGIVDRTAYNPFQGQTGDLPHKTQKPLPSITNPEKVGHLLLDIDRYTGNFVTICALRLAPYFALRPGSLRRLEWRHVDFERKEIRLPVEIMKELTFNKKNRAGETALVLPVARQPLEILEQLRQETGEGKYLFPGNDKDGLLSDGTLNGALKKGLGYDGKTPGYDGKPKDKMTSHGFRHMFSSCLHDLDYTKHALIERLLAHKAPEGKVSATYNQSKLEGPLRELMQEWADWLDDRKREARQREAEASQKTTDAK